MIKLYSVVDSRIAAYFGGEATLTWNLSPEDDVVSIWKGCGSQKELYVELAWNETITDEAEHRDHIQAFTDASNILHLTILNVTLDDYGEFLATTENTGGKGQCKLLHVWGELFSKLPFKVKFDFLMIFRFV